LSYCSKNTEGSCVNIGVFNELSIFYISKFNPVIEVFGLDAFHGMDGKGSKTNTNQYHKAETNISKFENAN
jgi:hypothetical protein